MASIICRLKTMLLLFVGRLLDFSQWGVSGEDGQLHSWILPYSTCFFAKAEYQNIPRKNWNLILEYTLLNFRIRLENDDAFVYPDVKCSVFSFGISS